MAEWTTEDVLVQVRKSAPSHFKLRAEDDFRAWLAAHDAEVRADEQTRILGGLLRLPVTRTQAWDRGWYSVSITDAISVVRDERCNGRDPGYEGTCPLPLNHLGGCFNDSWADA